MHTLCEGDVFYQWEKLMTGRAQLHRVYHFIEILTAHGKCKLSVIQLYCAQRARLVVVKPCAVS